MTTKERELKVLRLINRGVDTVGQLCTVVADLSVAEAVSITETLSKAGLICPVNPDDHDFTTTSGGECLAELSRPRSKSATQ